MGMARPSLAPTDTIKTTGKLGQRLGPAKDTGCTTSKSIHDRFLRAYFQQDNDPDRMVATIEGSSDLKPLSRRTIKVCADQSQMRLEGCDNGQYIDRRCKSDYFKTCVTSKRLRQKLVAHSVSISDQNSECLRGCRIVRRLRKHHRRFAWSTDKGSCIA